MRKNFRISQWCILSNVENMTKVPITPVWYDMYVITDILSFYDLIFLSTGIGLSGGYGMYIWFSMFFAQHLMLSSTMKEMCVLQENLKTINMIFLLRTFCWNMLLRKHSCKKSQPCIARMLHFSTTSRLPLENHALASYWPATTVCHQKSNAGILTYLQLK